ncbi:hypothetical protein DICSQDRAFT_67720, partial [Dichomitus squalens LYAD-421 SS1]
IYGYTYGIVAVDEAAKLRNLSKMWNAMSEALHRAHCPIAMTATPMHNSPLDLLNIGMALGVPECDDNAYATDIRREIGRTSRRATLEFNKASKEKDFVDNLVSGQVDLPAKKEQLHAMAKHIKTLRTFFQGYIIRRTLDALDFEGKPISGLAPFLSRTILLTPLEAEKKALAGSAAEISLVMGSGPPGTLGCALLTTLGPCARTSNITDLATQHFYMDHRRTHLNHKLREQDDWKPEDMEDYLANKSAKLDALVRILQWHLGEDNRPPLKLDDSENLVPDAEYPMPTPSPNAGPDRAVVYAAFPMNHAMIRQVLSLHGIESIEVNGRKGGSLREERFDMFKRSNRDQPRTLVMSNVGMMGLNLSEANILICLDQLWSYQEYLQLVGRLWRFPQPKPVFVYSLCLKDPTDMTLTVMSFTKAELLSAFTEASEDTRKCT